MPDPSGNGRKYDIGEAKAREGTLRAMSPLGKAGCVSYRRACHALSSAVRGKEQCDVCRRWQSKGGKGRRGCSVEMTRTPRFSSFSL